ncbi:MAG: branched-chain amino acid ABC transporter permease [Actinomycetia bacterium]|nr:branched-chain amino acid ABC transporter permease [Actinomycetes bacterium]
MNRGAMFTFKQGSSQHRTYLVVTWGLFLVFALLLPHILTAVFGEFQVGRMNRAIYLGVAIRGLNLLVGYSGLIALAQSAFMGTGAFLTTTLIMDHGWDYWMTIPAAMIAAFAVGVLLGVPALRIKGLYLALLTIAFAAVFPTLMKLDKWGIADRTGGVNGRNIDEKLVAPSWVRSIIRIDDTPQQQAIYKYYIIAALAMLAWIGTRNLLKSRPGRAIVAIRDNETGAAVSGINLPLYKTLTFGVSAALGGLAGVMWVMQSAFVGEQDFGFAPLAIPLLVGLVVGGVATLEGGLVGALVVVFVGEFTKNLGLDILSQSLFGLILILVTFFSPGGVIGLTKKVKALIIQVVPQPPVGVALESSSVDPAGGEGEEAVPEPAV